VLLFLDANALNAVSPVVLVLLPVDLLHRRAAEETEADTFDQIPDLRRRQEIPNDLGHPVVVQPQIGIQGETSIPVETGRPVSSSQEQDSVVAEHAMNFHDSVEKTLGRRIMESAARDNGSEIIGPERQSAHIRLLDMDVLETLLCELEERQ
jgi:hypothetical protein